MGRSAINSGRSFARRLLTRSDLRSPVIASRTGSGLAKRGETSGSIYSLLTSIAELFCAVSPGKA